MANDMYLFSGHRRESCHVAKGSTDYLRQGMKDSAVCHAVVAFPDVMAGDNDENSIFESKRAKCEIGSGKFFFHCRVKRAQSRSWTCVAKNYIPMRP